MIDDSKQEYREKIRRRTEHTLAQYGIDSPNLAERLVAQFAGEERMSQMFKCPNCDVALTVNLEVRVKRVRLMEEAANLSGNIDMVIPTPGSGFTPAENDLLAELESSGILQAYTDAFNRVMMITKPKDIKRSLLSWIENASKRTKIPQFAIRALMNEWAGMNLQIYAAQYIAAVVVEGKVMAFYPYHLLKGETVSKITASGGQITTMNEKPMTVEIWRRSKFGYVCGTGAYFSEMQKKSKGAFANT